jgi:hypothetical protein
MLLSRETYRWLEPMLYQKKLNDYTKKMKKEEREDAA